MRLFTTGNPLGRLVKGCLNAVFILCLAVQPSSAQGLRDLIGELFVFGDADDPLFLTGSADPSNPFNVRVHGDHFIPSAVASNQTLIGFLTNAVSTNVANIPIGATSGGRTFRFEGGAPVATSASPGPIFAERAQTLGRGRVLVGVNVNQFNFSTLRGVRLDNLRLTFIHENVTFPGCDSIFGDCASQGTPDFENDRIDLGLSLDLNVRATMFLLTYGVLDQIDIGVAIPVITTSLSGTSVAQVNPFGSAVNHFFGGTVSDPELSASRSIDGSATGLGDIAARLKIALGESFSILGDARFPTGDVSNLLGSGETSVRGLGVISKQYGNFSPHLNVGYLYRSGELQNDAVLATVGFDNLIAPWIAISVDFISELQVGENKLRIPEPTVLETPFRRTVNPTNIPNLRDDIISSSVGFKLVTPAGIRIIANSLWPLSDGGLRSNVAWTAGLEYNF